MRLNVKLKGYAPDLDPATPGIFTNAVSVIPSMRGHKAAPSPQDTGLAALAAACKGGAVIRKLDNSSRLFAGTATAMYENVSGTTWTDRTRAVGGAYALGDANRWRVAQFGDATLFASKSDTLQFTTSGALANVTGAPKSEIVETVGQFVMLLNTNEATFGDSTSRWWCSGIGDYTVWTPAISTQCATGLLSSSQGPIRAGRRLGDSMVAYKDKSMFIGQYVGPPVVWDWREVSDTVGAPCQEAVVPISTRAGGTAHIFMGFHDFYYYDGARPIPIGNPLKKTVFDSLQKTYRYKTWALHDPIDSLIYFHFVSSSVGDIDACVVYNYRKDEWGTDPRVIEAAVEFITAGVTYDGLGALFATYNTDIPFSYDSPFWVTGSSQPAIFKADHKIYTLTGTPGAASFTLAELGDDGPCSMVRRVRPRYITAPSSASLDNAYKMRAGDSFTNDGTTTLSSGQFDVMREASWHRLTHNSSGDMELADLAIDFEPGGEE